MKTITAADLQINVVRYLEIAETEDLLIMINDRPAGILRGLSSEDDLLDYQLESDPRFLERVKRARAQFRAGEGIRLENVRDELLADELN